MNIRRDIKAAWNGVGEIGRTGFIATPNFAQKQDKLSYLSHGNAHLATNFKSPYKLLHSTQFNAIR
jgi:hypothetical protein